jgi:holo-[acyl-carrier protein] synthase
MIVGIGVDLVEVGRIERAVRRYGDRFVGRVFTDREADYCRAGPHPEQRFAARFAAKEAALKALGVGWSQGVKFVEAEVSNNELGAPAVTFSGRALALSRKLGVGRVHVTMTHHRDFAIAQVVLEAPDQCA